jgi:hypothetical protein
MKDFKTEAEAKKLWCPHLRVVTDDEGIVTTNRGSYEQAVVCIASQCMFWRWSHQDTGVNDPPTGFCGAATLPKYI